ncbi:MAG: DUF2911 domain-containing protein [Gemmatimonadaceae bacterium]
MSALRSIWPAVALAAAACRPFSSAVPEPASAQRTYVLRLGSDTLAVDQFTISRDRVEGTLVTHLPRVVVTRYMVTIDPSTGRASRLQYNSRLPDGSLITGGNQAPVRQVTIDFAGDSAVARIERDTVVTVRAAAANAFPYLNYGMAFFQLPVSALRASNRDSASYAIYTGGRTTTPISVRRTGPNAFSLSITTFAFAVRTSDAGVVQTVDGSGTTQQFLATLQSAPVNMATLASTWRATELDRRSATTLSPRDTTRATIGGAQILIDYSRPRTRGRRVWGANGVLNDTLWRTGANAATQFRTNVPLTIGGREVPAGTYTLWTLAVPGRYQLIINKQTGQWGTQYDPAQDLARIPVQTRALSPAIEQFTIDVLPTGTNSGLLRLQWDTLELSVPFTAP